MKAEDMVMVIENRKGQETNSLLTFDDFIKQHIVPFANDKLEAVFMARELISNLFYEFGIQGIELEEPMGKNPLDYYHNEKILFSNNCSVSAYFPLLKSYKEYFASSGKPEFIIACPISLFLLS